VSVNKHLPHVFVLPEDDANRQLANGFQLEVDYARQRQMLVLPVAGGWAAVLEQFISDEVAGMDANAGRFMVLLIDFDEKNERLEAARSRIPERLRDRVFILGAWNEPEDLKSSLGTYETIGSGLARDCRDETDTIWEHDLLRHNAGELARLRERVRPILF
jgi:hypothetical protein